jgi:hypothetical protein
MKNTLIAILCLSFSLSALAHTSDHDVKPNLIFSSLKSVQGASNYLRVVPGQISGFNNVPTEKKKLLESFEVIEAVVNSNEFKQKVISFEGSGPKGGYTSSNNLTNEEVYNFLMQGKELIDGDTTLGEMNLDIKRYRPWYRSAVIGRTYPGKNNWIEVNGQHYWKMSVPEMASNITHEWIHLNGFYHASASDKHSVPYAVGYIVEELAEKYIAQGYLD